MKYKSLNCPHCGKKIKIEEDENVFICPYCENTVELDGEPEEEPVKRESRTAKVALEHGIPLLAQLPIDPALARECDTGVIELFNEDWMQAAVDAVEAAGHGKE